MANLISDRDTALLLLKIRNLVAEETGIRIPLSEEGAVDRFLEMADDTDNGKIKDAAAKLRRMLGQEQAAPAEEVPAGARVRVYRGVVQVIEGAGEGSTQKPAARDATQPRKGKVITYRGQKMVV